MSVQLQCTLIAFLYLAVGVTAQSCCAATASHKNSLTHVNKTSEFAVSFTKTLY